MKLIIRLLIVLFLIASCASLSKQTERFGAKKYGIINYYQEDQEYIVDYIIDPTELVKSVRIYYYTKQDGTWVQNPYVTYLEKKNPQGLFIERLGFTTDSLQSIPVKVVLYDYKYGHTGSGHSITYRDTIKLKQLFEFPLAENQ